MPTTPSSRPWSLALLGLVFLAGPLPAQPPRQAAPSGSGGSPRRVLAFYYTWYGTPALRQGFRHWDEHGHRPEARDERGWEDIGAAEHPLDGLYDSQDPAAIRRHARLSLEAGIDGWIATWWGIGDHSDQAFKLVLDTLEAARSPLELSPYYETCGRSAERAEKDLLHLLRTHGSHPRFLRHQGQPVIFIYSRALGELSRAEWVAIAGRVRREQPSVLVADSESPELIAAFGAGHNYNPVGLVKGGTDMGAYYRRFVDLCRWGPGRDRLGAIAGTAKPVAVATATVLPGYDDRQVREPGLHLPRDGGATYARLWREAAAAGPDWVLICSFNEWHEGTEIEPSREHGTYYLEETRARAAHWKGFRSPLETVKAGGAGEGIEVRVLAGLPAMEGFPYPQLLLQRDLYRDCLVLRNLGAVPYQASLEGFSGTVLEWSKGDDASLVPSVRALSLLAGSAGILRLDLSPLAQVHLWKDASLERHLEKGGYRGSEELREELKEGLGIEIGREEVIAGTPGLEITFQPRVVSLKGRLAADAGASEAGGEWRLEADPGLTLKEGKLSFSKDLKVGAEPWATLAWTRGERRLHRRLRTRIEPPVQIDSLELRGGRLGVAFRPRFPEAARRPIEAALLQGGSSLSRARSADWKPLRLEAGRRGQDPPAGPLTLELVWSGVSVRRELYLGAEIDLGAGLEAAGLRHVGHSGAGDGNSEPLEAAGRRARRPRPRAAAGELYLYFDLDPAFLASGPTEVHVDYLDAARGSFVIHYDSRDEKLPLGGAYKPTRRIELSGTGAWKTCTLRLDDAAFRSRENSGADFRIAASFPLPVARVSVRKVGG